MKFLSNKSFLFLLVFLWISFSGIAQKTIHVEITNVSTTAGDCDGFLLGDSEHFWWWTGPGEVDDQCHEGPSQNGPYNQNVSIDLLNESYDCESDAPSSLDVNFHGCENDGVGSCVLGLATPICTDGSISVTATIPIPSVNGSYGPTVICITKGGACSGDYCYTYTIDVTGSFIDPVNDDLCNAIDLGVYNLGDNILSTGHTNICADTEPGEPSPTHDVESSVWFSFTTGPNTAATTYIDGINNSSDNIDMQLSLFESSNGTCTGALNLVDSDYDPVIFSETMEVECLMPNTTYYLQVDGFRDGIINAFEEGNFDIQITDDGVPHQYNDDICDATDLGTIPDAGSVTLTDQNNICGTLEPGEPRANLFLTAFADQTVWYQFKPPSSGSVDIDLSNTGADNIDINVAVWTSSDTTCNGFFGQVEAEDILTSFDITGTDILRVRCLDTALTYWIQVDGFDDLLLEIITQGIFDLTVSDGLDFPAPHDSICDAIPMGDPSGGPITLSDQNNFCSDNIQEPYPSAFGTNNTVWYSFIAPPSGAVDIDAISDPLGVGDEVDIQLAVFGTDGSCLGTPFEMASEWNDLLDPYIFGLPPNSEHLLATCLTPGQTYYIMVDGSEFFDIQSVEGLFEITLTEHPGPGPITNDNICDAIPLGAVPAAGNVSSMNHVNYCATVEPGEPVPDAFSDLDQTVWFTFEAPPSGNVTVELFDDPLSQGDGIELQGAIYASSNGTCSGTLYEVESDWDPLIIVGGEEITVRCLEPGATYWVQVDGWEEPITGYLVEGYFGIEVSEDAPYPVVPSNNNICAQHDFGVIPNGGATPVLSTSNYCATEEPSEPNVSGGGGFFDAMSDETVWFAFTTSATPGSITISVTNTGGEDPLFPLIPSFNIYELTVAPGCDYSDLTQVASNDNILPFLDISSDMECPKPNTTYLIQLDGLDILGDMGTFDIQVSDNGVPVPNAPNDDICASVDLGVVPASGSTAIYSGDNFCASEEPNEPNVSGGTLITDFGYDETVWFTFTTSATPGLTTVQAVSTAGIDINLTAYSPLSSPSCDFNDILEIDSADDLISDDATLELPCLLPNTTYYVQIDGGDLLGDNGTFDISVFDTGPPNTWPTNDDICNVQSLGVVPASGSTGQVPGNNFCATEEVGEPFTSGSLIVSDSDYDETVWFSFTTSATPGLITVLLDNEVGISGGFEVFSLANSPTCDFNDLIYINGDGNSLSIECLPPNTTYFIQVDGDDVFGNYGSFTLEVTDDGSVSSWPANDSICNATGMGVLNSGGSLSQLGQANFCAGEEPAEPNVSGLTDLTDNDYDESVWYCFTTGPAPGTVSVDVTNTSGIFANINVYENSTGSCDYADLEYDRGTGPNILTGDASLDLVCLDANTEYCIQVDGADALGNEGTFDISVSDDGTPQGPEIYNEICNALILGNPSGGTVSAISVDNNCADEELGEPGVTGDDESVWFQFTAPNSGQVDININSIEYIDANFSLYHSTDGSCNFGSLDQLGGNHDDLFSFSVSHSETCLIPGETYYIQVDGGDLFGDMGAFDVIVDDAQVPFTPPANDECGGATPLTVQPEPCQGSGNWEVYDYLDPTVSMDANCGANCGDTWYSFTMPISGSALIEGDDEYSGFPGINNSEVTINAYSGPCAGLTPLNCDQGGLGADPFFYVNGAPGSTVYLQVFDDGGDDINEDFGLCVSDRCGQDSCQNAEVMQMVVPYCFDNDGASGEDVGAGVPGYAECGDGSNSDNSVYFSFTTSSCTYFQININAFIGGTCVAGVATDGLSFSLYEDSSPCDNNYESLVDCQITDACIGSSWTFTKEYTGFPIGSTFIIQLDAFGGFGGNVDGFISFNEVCPLGVDLLNFTGENEDDINVLEWTTTDFNKNERFVVERSFDGENFIEIGTVEGNDFVGGASGGSAGGNSESANYKFIDRTPSAGHNFYRLQMVGKDGGVAQSNVVDLFIDSDFKDQILNVYPNPTSGSINLDLTAIRDGDYKISIIDLLGNRIVSTESNLNLGLNHLSFNLEDIADGLYLVEVVNISTAQKQVARFVKN